MDPQIATLIDITPSPEALAAQADLHARAGQMGGRGIPALRSEPHATRSPRRSHARPMPRRASMPSGRSRRPASASRPTRSSRTSSRACPFWSIYRDWDFVNPKVNDAESVSSRCRGRRAWSSRWFPRPIRSRPSISRSLLRDADAQCHRAVATSGGPGMRRRCRADLGCCGRKRRARRMAPSR